MIHWIQGRWALVRATIGAGDVYAFERRYLPAAILVGMAIGAALTLLSQLFAVVLILMGGFGLGYAARAYLSYRRRMEYLRRRGELL